MNAGTTRRALLVGIGVLAAAGGAWWQARRAAPSSAAAAGAAGGADAAFWALRLPRPEGGELVLADFRGQPLLVNFWATWCPPCIKELPEIDRFARSHASRLKVVGLALDNLAPVQEFLKRQPVGFAIGLAGFGGSDLARSLGNNAGALPFTVLLDGSGAVVRSKLGETHYAELEAWAATL
ncbi:MAG TPA: TlpA disulfide reductase family protein [Rubrivivax sp.]|nr:TlpA disulfide reductase family protein [Rubrivivax sp.]